MNTCELTGLLSLSLGKIAPLFGIDTSKAHTALGDVDTTTSMYNMVLDYIKKHSYDMLGFRAKRLLNRRESRRKHE